MSRPTDEDIDADIVECLVFGNVVVAAETLREDEDEEGSGDMDDEVDLIPSSLDESRLAAAMAKRKRQRMTLKEEIMYLKAKQRELVVQLDALTPVVTSCEASAVSSSVWEGRAKAQLQAAQKAMRENAALRSMLADQLKTTQALERILKKKPKLEASRPCDPHYAWREWRLDTADPARRLEAMHSITIHVYEKLDSEFIQSGVFDLAAGQSGLSVRTRQNVLWFDFVQSSVLEVPYATMQALAWAVACFDTPLTGGSVVLQRINDCHMVYTRTNSTFPSSGFCTEGRWLTRLFRESNRTVVVYRSLVDDVLVPHAPNQWRDNFVAWVVLEPCPSDPATKTRQSFLHQTTPCMAPPDSGRRNGGSMMSQGKLTEFLLTILQSRVKDVEDTVARHVDTEHAASRGDST
ncbi:Aste57867_11467 [Aphanomyces stellatus]|uniref:Aste57867_11467 protein n=1 Tax=Aphanomyces stellatus TaxID=120398 RepID=A0A485KU77_9STRA|nr:hypothetical protein As57867_011424 [Aphanomyces stellatus]VFT88328.1 Aste57867_11467 [Aphanomyces stellatus]